MNSPTIVTLCGSTKFGDQFAKSQLDETLRGNIVLTIGCNMRTDQEIFKDFTELELRNIKAKLDILHLRKIEMSNEILVLNVDGYIGESTEREIEYAKSIGIKIRYLEELKDNE
jgi:hypothetical protein